MKKLSLVVLVSSVVLLPGLSTQSLAEGLGGIGGDMTQEAAKDAVKEQAKEAVKAKAEELVKGAGGEGKAEATEASGTQAETTDASGSTAGDKGAEDASTEEPAAVTP